MNKYNEEINKVENTPDQIIETHMYWAVAAGCIPVPVADIAAVTAIQLDMMAQIANYYDADYSKSQGKAWITAITTATASSAIARFGASLVKTIPVVGQIVGSTAMAVTSGASTYAIGQVINQHFAEGGTIDNFHAAKVKEAYEEMKEEGKEFAKDMAAKFKKEEVVIEIETESVSEKLKKINKLYKKGKISKKEYKKMRDEILTDLIA